MSRKQIPNPIIANLLQIRGQWTLEHLKDALQAAIELEFATLPPYLSAYWSIKDPTAEYSSFKSGLWSREYPCVITIGLYEIVSNSFS